MTGACETPPPTSRLGTEGSALPFSGRLAHVSWRPIVLRWGAAGAVLAVSGGVALLSGARSVVADDLQRPFAVRQAGWAGSTTCKSCHPDHHASWHRTFHRTMTQDATAGAVAGAFDGRTVRYQGVDARPVERDGRFFLEFADLASGRTAVFEIERTVGSRRYQQYLARRPGDPNFYRLPLLWHIGERRWVHLNGAFLGADGEDYWAHFATWNANCIFCHNTGPEPGLRNYPAMMDRQSRGEPVSFDRDARFESHVAELGVACESCHGPASEHARRNRNPLRRYVLHAGARRDPTIVHPEALPPERQVDLCGQCHGQRTGHSVDDLVGWMENGPTFRAGDRLADHVQPVWRDTPVPPGVDPELFRPRFWADGTPRLTAYEYQGIVQSPCFQRGELSCLSCHTMHEGDVRGQLQPAMRTQAACINCHRGIGADVQAHTHHLPDGPGSNCYGCHMPRAVYGIMEIHRSHRIESPDAARDAAAGRPDACTSCHVDRSLAWAARSTAAWWGPSRGRAPGTRAEGADLETVDVVASLAAGDPLQRAVAARVVDVEETPLPARHRAFLIPHLLLALEDDYPAVRRFAAMSLASLVAELEADGFACGLAEPLAELDFLATPGERQRRVAELWRRWRAADRAGLPPPPAGALLTADLLPLPVLEALRAGRRRPQEINIGE